MDGIVLEDNATGTTTNSKAITHEAGHFFGLYHTFHPSEGPSMCPPNSDCHNDGDKICDTRPHPKLDNPGNFFPCNESQYLGCDGSAYTYNVIENHMNYTDDACRNEFTYDQVMRMRCALMTERSSLMHSLGCLPGCDDVITSFDGPPSSLQLEEGDSFTFTNTSTGANSYLWEVGLFSSPSTDLNYQFVERGYYDICLTASDGTCTNRACIQVKVIGPEPCFSTASECDLLVNGSFIESNFQYSKFVPGVFGGNLNRVCNWRQRIGNADLYNQNNLIAAVIAGGNDGTNESFITEDLLLFEEGQSYEILFDYSAVIPAEATFLSEPRLEIGLEGTNYSWSIIPQDFVDASRPEIILQGAVHAEDFETVSICFTPQENITAELYFWAFHTTIEPAIEAVHYLIKEISVQCRDACCTAIPDFTYDVDCPKEFSGTNDGDEGEYTWTFGCNKVTMNGQNVTLDLPPGECEVCLSIACHEESVATVCKTVMVPAESDPCPAACTDLPIELQICQQLDGQENLFIAQTEIVVPDGTTACDGIDILSGSGLIDIDLMSVSIVDDPSDITQDIITLSIQVRANAGVDVLGGEIAGVINLCKEDGEVLCYNVIFVGQACENCLGEIPVTAECEDPNPIDDLFVYEGSVTLNLPPLGFGEVYTACGYTSTELGYQQTSNIIGHIATIDFTITTTTEGDFKVPVLLCFRKGNAQYCYTIIVEIEGCPVPPLECDNRWDPKEVSCTDSEDGTFTYNFSMGQGSLGSDGFHICAFGLEGTLTDLDDNPIPGASVQVNSGSQINGSFVFDIDVIVPCEYAGSTVGLRLYFCDSNEDLVCYYFPLVLTSCILDCDERRVEGRSAASWSTDHTLLRIHPNPANHAVVISVTSTQAEPYTLELFDQLGRLVFQEDFILSSRIDISDRSPGLHLVRVMDATGRSVGLEKLMIVD